MDGKIIGFKIKPKGAEVNYTSNKLEGGENTFKKHIVHVERKTSANFNNIIRTLLTHALIWAELDNKKITEVEVKNRKAVDMPAFKSYQVTGFSIQGEDEDEKLNVSLSKVNAHGVTFNFQIPKIPIASGEYPHETTLASDIDMVIAEVQKYIDGDNYFQAELSFPENTEEKKSSKKSKEKEEDDFKQF